MKQDVYRANLELVVHGLVTLTWGNASGIDRRRGIVAIKPSGVSYDELSADAIVLIDLDGRVVEGTLRPSTDAATHLYLYRHFDSVGGIVHTHSRGATIFAQARREIPCFGTTHADHFHGPVPVTRPLSPEETAEDYEGGTGRVIVERFQQLDPAAMPAVLVPGHGPFVWGEDVSRAMHNAVALEAVADMALGTMLLDSDARALEPFVLEKHFLRKHGGAAYYGQK
ncbi:MAG: L-ribulose-5-phosphate 4-epimerase AraD [Pirellulaceae bacterium]|nr:L-ribulose-5-phosphate 4-epimerase AraD [Pirellulaceae bacterium]